MQKKSSMKSMQNKPRVAVTQSTFNVASGKLDLLHVPLIQLLPLPFDKSVLHREYDWLVLTSKNAVDIFMAYKDELSVKKIASIGEKTTRHIQKYGLEVDFEPKVFTQEGFIEEFKVSRPYKVLYPTSKHARNKLNDYLLDKNCFVEKINLYESAPNEDSVFYLKEHFDEMEALTVSSPSAAHILNQNFSREMLCDKIVVAIGAVTASALSEHGIQAEVPEKETLESMVNLIEELI